MRHELTFSGFAFRLRPVNLSDAESIVALQIDPRNGHYINDTSPRVADQEAWLQQYFERPGDWYFIVESLAKGHVEGLIGIYAYDSVANAAEWGRWIVRANSIAAMKSVLLLYRIAFDVIGLDSVYCRTVADNHKVVSFHDSSGALRTSVLKGAVTIRGITFDQIEHQVDRVRWAEIEPKLTQLARLTALRRSRETA